MTNRHRNLALLVALPLVAGLAACSSSDDSSSSTAAPPTGAVTTTTMGVTTVAPTTLAPTTAPPTTAAPTTAAPTTVPPPRCTPGTPTAYALDTGGHTLDGLKVAVLYDFGGRTDRGPNEAVASVADIAGAQMDAVVTEFTVTKLDGTDRGPLLEQALTGGAEAVIAVGAGWTGVLGQMAPQHPDVEFVLLDGEVLDNNGTPDDRSDDKPLANVMNVTYAVNEGSFLMGVAAACATTTGKVGFIGGVEMDAIKDFEVGFAAGVAALDPSTTVETRYLAPAGDFSGFNSPDEAKQEAEAMLADGVDVIFPAAGASGTGVYDAVSQSGKAAGEAYVIGVDADQYVLVDEAVRPYVLTSLIKRYDVGAMNFLVSIATDSFTAGTAKLGAGEGLMYSASNTDVLAFIGTIEQWRAKISAGTVVVPTAV